MLPFGLFGLRGMIGFSKGPKRKWGRSLMRSRHYLGVGVSIDWILVPLCSSNGVGTLWIVYLGRFFGVFGAAARIVVSGGS
jgi:hypothetical protein